MPISDAFRLNNKVAIITGASKGIGKAIAHSFGQQGAKVIVVSRKADAVNETAAEFRKEGIDATGIAAHMGDINQIKSLIEQTIKFMEA